MSGDPWTAVISRITADAPFDLDAAVFPAPAAMPAGAISGAPAGAVGGPAADIDGPAAAPPPVAALWSVADRDRAHVGLRVLAAPADPAATAFRLAAAAVERGVVPIVLSHCASSGFERFGFRVERLTGATVDARAAEEAELSRFWNIAIILDADEIAGLD